jgi:hypothetical protein
MDAFGGEGSGLGTRVGLVARARRGLDGSREGCTFTTGDILESWTGDFVGDFRCAGRLGRSGFHPSCFVGGNGVRDELDTSKESSGGAGELAFWADENSSEACGGEGRLGSMRGAPSEASVSVIKWETDISSSSTDTGATDGLRGDNSVRAAWMLSTESCVLGKLVGEVGAGVGSGVGTGGGAGALAWDGTSATGRDEVVAIGVLNSMGADDIGVEGSSRAWGSGESIRGEQEGESEHGDGGETGSWEWKGAIGMKREGEEVTGPASESPSAVNRREATLPSGELIGSFRRVKLSVALGDASGWKIGATSSCSSGAGFEKYVA